MFPTGGLGRAGLPAPESAPGRRCGLGVWRAGGPCVDVGVAEARAEGRSPGPGTKGCPRLGAPEGWLDGGLGHLGRELRAAACGWFEPLPSCWPPEGLGVVGFPWWAFLGCPGLLSLPEGGLPGLGCPPAWWTHGSPRAAPGPSPSPGVVWRLVCGSHAGSGPLSASPAGLKELLMELMALQLPTPAAGPPRRGASAPSLPAAGRLLSVTSPARSRRRGASACAGLQAPAAPASAAAAGVGRDLCRPLGTLPAV